MTSKNESLAVALPFALIYINHSTNIREEAHGVWPIESVGDFQKGKDQKELIESFQLRGISLNDEPIRVCGVGKNPGDLTKEDIDKCLVEREQFLKDLQARSANDSESLLLHFILSYLWKQGTDKLVKPTHRLIAGFQRTTAYVMSRVNLLRDALNADKKLDVQKFVKTICEPNSFAAATYQFKSLLEMKICQAEENQQKAEGARKMGFVQLLKLADQMMDENLKQSDLRRVFNVGMGQKLHGILTIDRRFPKLRLVARLMLPKNDPEYLDWGKLPQDWSKIVRESDAEWVTKNNEKYRDDDKKQVKLQDEAAVNRTLVELSTRANTNADKMMAKDDIGNLRTANRSDLVKMVADAVYTNDSEKLKPARVIYPATNALLSISQNRPEVYPQLQAVILKLAEMSPEQFVKSLRGIAEQLKVTGQDVKNATVEVAKV